MEDMIKRPKYQMILNLNSAWHFLDKYGNAVLADRIYELVEDMYSSNLPDPKFPDTINRGVWVDLKRTVYRILAKIKGG